MEEFAEKLDQDEINTVYCFGDNPLSDVYGANLFTKTLNKARKEGKVNVCHVASLEKCISVLVGTGVWNPSEPEPEEIEVDYGHRDLPFNPQLCKGKYPLLKLSKTRIMTGHNFYIRPVYRLSLNLI